MSQRYEGCVKFFDKGYGFITVLREVGSTEVVPEEERTTVFVHFSGLRTGEEQFKYLTQGEYVEFITSTNEEGKTQATDVTGIAEGLTRCESLAQIRKAKREYTATHRGTEHRGTEHRGSDETHLCPDEGHRSDEEGYTRVSRGRDTRDRDTRTRDTRTRDTRTKNTRGRGGALLVLK